MKTCFREKFGTPRQSLMVADARGTLKLREDPGFELALQQLDTFSHLWILFVFHQHLEKPWHPVIRPPREDGPPKVGVFASRSPHRPNPLGISIVKLEKIDLKAPGGIEIHVSGVDLLDDTPVLDIKPYLPYADSVPDADAGWARHEIPRYAVSFSAASRQSIARQADFPRLQQLIEQTLSWDPRPTSQKKARPITDPASEGCVFRFRIADWDVEWQVRERAILVLDLFDLPEA